MGISLNTDHQKRDEVKGIACTSLNEFVYVHYLSCLSMNLYFNIIYVIFNILCKHLGRIHSTIHHIC